MKTKLALYFKTVYFSIQYNIRVRINVCDYSSCSVAHLNKIKWQRNVRHSVYRIDHDCEVFAFIFNVYFGEMNRTTQKPLAAERKKTKRILSRHTRGQAKY